MDLEPASAFDDLLKERDVIVDTSSLLLAGTNLLTIIPKSRLVIPAVVVKELEEKRSNTRVGFLAREWLRLLEELRVEFGDGLSIGVSIPKYPEITVRIEPNHSNQNNLPNHLRDGSNDSTVLAVAANLKAESDTNNVVLLSNDSPMRLHATLDLKIDAVEFNATQAMFAKPYNGKIEVNLSNEEYLLSDEINSDGKPFESIVSAHLRETPSHALISVSLEDDEKSLSELIYANGQLEPVSRKTRAFGITARTLEQDVALSYLLEDPEDLPVVSLGGNAGTGKTLLSVAAGLKKLKAGKYQKLVVFRSLHEMGRGQELGFLPGDVKEKMEVWAGAIYDALDVISVSGKKGKPANAAESKKLRELVEVSPITYLRGRSLSNSYVILDEAQNFSRSELLNILSRAGEGTKMVLCFDPHQVDNKFLQSGNRADIWSVVDSLKNEDIFAHITLTRTERSKVAAITSRLLAN